VGGPFSDLGYGPVTVTAAGSSNPAADTRTVTIAEPPTASVADQTLQDTLTLTGLAGAGVRVFIDDKPILYTLDGTGKAIKAIEMAPGSYQVSAQYFEGGRFGPMGPAAGVTIK
jgi:hypothetical protein